jgi:hypothetical protein
MTMRRAGLIVLAMVIVTSPAFAHSGPPFQIVARETHGPYTISLWTDPDATDNGVAAGQFWIVIEPSNKRTAIPPQTTATLSVRGSDATAPAGPRAAESALRASASPVRGDVTNQFALVTLDHEGPFAVHVEVDGPLGRASTDSRVDATYDLRPAPYMLVWYLGPFVLAGLLWTRLLLKRRAAQRQGPRGDGPAHSGRVQPR